MVWVYDSPPSSKQEKELYKKLKRRLKREEHIQKTIKLISLYLFLKRSRFRTPEQLQGSAFYDKERTRPIFTARTARAVFNALHKKGGAKSTYPYTDTLVKGVLRDYTPDIIGTPVGEVYGLVTSTVDGIKSVIPFSDLAMKGFHSLTESGVTAAGDIAEGVGGPIGAAGIAPFTGIAAAIASGVSIVDGDLGQAVAHFANFVPAIGSFLGKNLTKMEEFAEELEKHETISSFIPYMNERHQRVRQPEGGKRLSTIRRSSNKWMKTVRKKSATH